MDKLLTILHVIPTLEIGGAERQLVLLCMEQARRGYDVHVAVRRKGEFIHLLDSSRISIHVIGNYPGLNPFLFFSLNRLITKVAPTIIQTWSSQMDIIGGAAALFGRVSWIATERSGFEFYNQDRWSVSNLLRKKIISLSSAIVANSTSGAEMWKKFSPDSLVYCVTNGVDLESIKRIMSSDNVLEGDGYVLMVGRFIDSKGFLEVLEAISGLADKTNHKFKIIGQGPLADYLIAQIEKLNLNDRVQLIKNHPEWWIELRGAKLLISMSRFEGTPNVVLEAAAAGCPLLLSDIPAHREIFDNDSAIFVELDKKYELINAIENLFVNYCDAKKRAVKAKEIVTKMSVVEMVNSYSAIYEKTLKTPAC